MNTLLLNAALSGIAIALVSGPIGCCVVWRQMAFVGETMAHAALLAVSLALLFELGVDWVVFVVSITAGVLLLLLQRSKQLTTDSSLSLIAHSMLSLGLLLLALRPSAQINWYGILFGDILTVSTVNVYLIAAASLIILTILYCIWQPLLLYIINKEMATAEQVPRYIEVVFFLLLAAIVSMAIKVVGTLLLTGLLVIPALAARFAAQSPSGMAIMASIIGSIAVISGLGASYFFDTPTGPSIVLCALSVFIMLRLANVVRSHNG